MKIDRFDYRLPSELIAVWPSERRDESRLMVVSRAGGGITHARFCDLPEFLRPEDCLVLNDTRVLPARLVGRRKATGGKWEGLFVGQEPAGGDGQFLPREVRWRVLCQTRGKLQAGEEVEIADAASSEKLRRRASRKTGRSSATAVTGSDAGATRVAVREGRHRRDAGATGVAVHDGCHRRDAGATGVAVRSSLTLTLCEKDASGTWLVRPESEWSTLALLERYGRVPLPPYVQRSRDAGRGSRVEGAGPRDGSPSTFDSRPSTLPGPQPVFASETLDRDRYQTVYARIPGAVAAPTAGLHFTPELLERLGDKGVGRVFATLHVGPGTFRPITAEHVEEHRMHAEWGSLSEEAAKELRRRRAAGGRIVAVGTTSVRLLETAAATSAERGMRSAEGEMGHSELRIPNSALPEAWSGSTDLYIRPTYRFRAVDALITNFHLPRTSLLVLVGTMLGVDLLHAAYAEAIRERYRFYSYGDAMLIL